MKTKKPTPEDVKNSTNDEFMEAIKEARKSGKNLGVPRHMMPKEDLGVPMRHMMPGKDEEYDLGDGLKYKPSEIKPKVTKDGLMLLKKGGSTNKYARGGGIESRGKTKGRFV